jgi:hypothetical protein
MQARHDRWIGYGEPDAIRHRTLDEDTSMQAETDNTAHAVVNAVSELRAGRLLRPSEALKPPHAE